MKDAAAGEALGTTGANWLSDRETDTLNEVVFRPFSRQTLSSQIRDRLLERITSGARNPGRRVLSERVLFEQFGLTRTSVREVVQGLLSTGVIVRRGNRSYDVEHLPDVSFGDEDSLLGNAMAMAMAKALADANVPTTLSVVAGLDHVFHYAERQLPLLVTPEMERILDWLSERIGVPAP